MANVMPLPAVIPVPVSNSLVPFEDAFAKPEVFLAKSAITDTAIQQVVSCLMQKKNAEHVVSIDLSDVTSITPTVLTELSKFPKLQSLNILGCTAFTETVSWLTPFLKSKPSDVCTLAVIASFKQRVLEEQGRNPFLFSLTRYFDQLASTVWSPKPLFEKEDNNKNRVPLYVLCRLAFLAATYEHQGKEAFLVALEPQEKNRDEFFFDDEIVGRSFSLYPHYNVQKKGEFETVLLLFAEKRRATFYGEGSYKKVFPTIEVTLGNYQNDVDRTVAYALVTIDREYTREVLERELKTYATVAGLPGIVPFYKFTDYTSTSKTLGIMMKPYVAGSLEQVFEKEKPLCLLQKQDIIACLIVGLYSIHKKNHVHGDLKAANVLLEYLQNQCVRAVYIDFGLAIHTSKVSRIAYNPTPEYAPYEYIALNQNNISYYKMEMGSLGSLFYDLLFEKYPPWAGAIRDVFEYVTDMPTVLWSKYEKGKDAFFSKMDECVDCIEGAHGIYDRQKVEKLCKKAVEGFKQGVAEGHRYLQENALDRITYEEELQPLEDKLFREVEKAITALKTEGTGNEAHELELCDAIEASFEENLVLIKHYIDDHVPVAIPSRTKTLQGIAEKAFKKGYKELEAEKDREIERVLAKPENKSYDKARAQLLYNVMHALIEPDLKKRISLTEAMIKIAPLYGVAVKNKTNDGVHKELVRILGLSSVQL